MDIINSLLKTGSKTANINVKTAKIIKVSVNHTNVDIQAMLVWLTLPFYDFAVFDPSPLAVCINCSCFYIYLINITNSMR